MKGDFTRDTFDPAHNYLSVLMQQGRVQMDADWNEQAAIVLHYLQSLAADLIGSFGGRGNGFLIDAKRNSDGTLQNLTIAPGRYYVEGRLCENLDAEATYLKQAYHEKVPTFPDFPFLVYLEVWERHVTAVEDPNLAEVALGGADTATRRQLVWQVKITEHLTIVEDDKFANKVRSANTWQQWNKALSEHNVSPLPFSLWEPGTGKLKARTKPGDKGDACLLPSDSQYRGLENQLYRVEIHKEGKQGEATFKWSRENGSVIFPIRQHGDKTLTLAHLGRDERLGLEAGNWVEAIDDLSTLNRETRSLHRVLGVDVMEMTVTLETSPVSLSDKPDQHPYLRRWEQKELPLVIGKGDEGWIPLEEGIEIQFQEGEYRTGDYWLIPARTETGEILWPKDPNHPELPLAVAPYAVPIYRAPLALIRKKTAGEGAQVDDLRHPLGG